MLRATLHGIEIAWSYHGLARDHLGELFSMLPDAGAEAQNRLENEPIRFTLHPAGDAAATDPRAEGWEPSFFHGVVQAYRGPSGFLLSDRASRVLVPSAGSPIEAEIAPPEREQVAGSASVALQIALQIALRTRRLFHLHAAALVHPSGAGVLVVGGSGAGKTTTTIALLEAGYGYLGDDTLFLAAPPHEGGVDIVAFPREFHLGPATLAAFPRLVPFAGPPAGRTDKRPVDPRLAFAAAPRALLPVRSGGLLALFPAVADADATELLALPRADAFGNLVASSAALVIEGAARREENLALLRALLESARCFDLRLGRDVLSRPASAVAPAVALALRPA